MSTTSRRILLTVCLVLTGLAVGVPSAWAHHPVLSGDVKCTTDGHAVVTWHLTNSETVAGSNRTMVVDSATLSSGTLTGIGAGTSVGPQTAAGIPTVNGSSTYAGTQTGQVTLSVSAHWINANGTLANIQASASASVTLPGTCKTPSDPHATIANSCADGGVKIVLSNNGQTATSFDVSKNGTKIDTVAVAGGGSVTKIYPMNEDETANYRAKADNYDSGNVSVTHDCTKPAASIANSCADGGVKIVLTNGGVSGTSFDIFKNGTKIDTVAVAAGGSVTKTYVMNEDETANFRAKADNYDSGNVSVTHDCTKPAASIANSCADGGVKMVLTNGGVLPVSFIVTKAGTKIDTVAVAAGGSVTKTYAMAEDETAVFRAKASNYDSGDVSITHNCTNPGAVVANSCTAGGAVFTLTNTGVSSTTFDISKAGTKIDSVLVAGGATVTKTYAMAEDETAVFRAKTSDGFDSGDKSLTHNCTNPAAAVSNSCTAGGAVFVLSNTGELADSMVISKNGADIDTVLVAAGATVTKTYAMAEDETAVFRAKTADGFDSGNKSITHNCTSPAASVANSCTAGGAVFTLSNGGTNPVTFAISRNGTAADSVLVNGFATVTKTYTMAEDEKSTFQAKTAGFDSGAISVTHDCAPAVLGVQFTAPNALPRTGSNTLPMALRGIALVLLGFVLVRFTGMLRRSNNA